MVSDIWVKDHSDSERGNALPPPYGLLFPISSNGSFICAIPHTTAFVTPVMDHWLEPEIVQWVHHEELDLRDSWIQTGPSL